MREDASFNYWWNNNQWVSLHVSGEPAAIGNRMVCSAGVRNIILHSSIYKGMYTSVNNSCLLLRIMEIKCNGNMSHSSLWLLFETLLCCYKHPLNYSQDMSINVHRCTWKTCYFCPYLTKTGVCWQNSIKIVYSFSRVFTSTDKQMDKTTLIPSP